MVDPHSLLSLLNSIHGDIPKSTAPACFSVVNDLHILCILEQKERENITYKLRPNRNDEENSADETDCLTNR